MYHIDTPLCTVNSLFLQISLLLHTIIELIIAECGQTITNSSLLIHCHWLSDCDHSSQQVISIQSSNPGIICIPQIIAFCIYILYHISCQIIHIPMLYNIFSISDFYKSVHIIITICVPCTIIPDCIILLRQNTFTQIITGIIFFTKNSAIRINCLNSVMVHIVLIHDSCGFARLHIRCVLSKEISPEIMLICICSTVRPYYSVKVLPYIIFINIASAIICSLIITIWKYFFCNICRCIIVISGNITFFITQHCLVSQTVISICSTTQFILYFNHISGRVIFIANRIALCCCVFCRIWK